MFVRDGGDEYSTPSFCTTQKTSGANAFKQETLLEVTTSDEGDEHSTPSTH